MKSALITGSHGFIGRHLTQDLKKQQVKVIEFSRHDGQDVADAAAFDHLPPVEVVFHLAAVSGYCDCNADTRLAYQVNVGGTVNILEYCRKNKAKLIFPSTYIYDAPYEKYKQETDPAKPTTHYAFTKYLGEELCRFYSRIFKVNTLIIRTGNVYGQGQSEIYLIPIIAKHLKQNQPLQLTEPEIERSFIYIKDLIQAYLVLAEAKTKPGEAFNASSNHATTIAELIKTVEKVTGRQVKVKYSGHERPNEISLNRLDNSKLKLAGWRPEYNLEQGLKELQRSNYF